MNMGSIDINGKTIMITGAAGFIGSHLCKYILNYHSNVMVIGLDSLNEYYDVKLKNYRLQKLCEYDDFTFIKLNIADREMLLSVFEQYRPHIVVNLAAQAGVRYSVSNPEVYIESNIDGFFNILEACRRYPVEHLIFASSSSVYGNNDSIPYSTSDMTDSPESLYAATKKSNELMAYAYSKLFEIPTTGLRFFSVYGPMGRPDMAYYLFTDKIIQGEKIKLYNYGKCRRDFTYIDDVILGIVKVIGKCPTIDDRGHPYKIYNIGNNTPVVMNDFLDILLEELSAIHLLPANFSFEQYVELLPIQPGDVDVTYADMTEMNKDFDFKTSVDIRKGLHEFVSWYKKYLDEFK